MARRWINSIPRARGVYILGQGLGSLINTGTSETKLGSVLVPAGLMGVTGLLRCWTRWKFTNSGNTKAMRVRFGAADDLTGTTFMLSNATTSATLRAVTEIQNNNSASAQVSVGSSSSFGTASTTTSVTATINTANDAYVVMSGTPGAGGEEVNLLGYLVDFIPGV